MIRIYSLTRFGKRVARNINNPNTPPYMVVSYLDKTGHATKDQIAAYTGLDDSAVGGVLARLQRVNPPIVEEAGGG